MREEWETRERNISADTKISEGEEAGALHTKKEIILHLIVSNIVLIDHDFTLYFLVLRFCIEYISLPNSLYK